MQRGVPDQLAHPFDVGRGRNDVDGPLNLDLTGQASVPMRSVLAKPGKLGNRKWSAGEKRRQDFLDRCPLAR
jgi:hypothetical protein